MATNFEKAFAANRKAGKKVFSFGGKSYNTKLAPSAPKKVPVPADKPARSTSGGPTKRYANNEPIESDVMSADRRYANGTGKKKAVTDRMPSDFKVTGQKQSMSDASSGPVTRKVTQLTDAVYPSEFSVKIRDARARKADKKPQEKY